MRWLDPAIDLRVADSAGASGRLRAFRPSRGHTSTTGALELYERAGMYVAKQPDMFERPLAPLAEF